jgi:Spx/MgsR family transcriptional regulator
MTLCVYGISNCSTVKKALIWLQQQGIAYQFHDYKKQGIDAATVSAWLQQQPWEKLVNRSGMTWRNLTPAEQASVSDAPSAQKLMLEKTSVIKRPLLVQDGKIIALGFDAQHYQEIFGV